MPNRIIKDTICTSDSLNQLNWFEEVLFYRLIVSCDDFGRYDGRTAVIKNRLFPLKENLTLKNVESAIEKLARVGLIILYEYDGIPFLFLPTWGNHQTMRATKSKYPDPEECSILKTSENNCLQPKAEENECARIRIRNSISDIRNSNASNTRDVEAEFESFWSAYPRKAGSKKKAMDAFAKVEVPLQTVLDAVEAQKKTPQWQKDNGQFIPHPTTWLNGKRWEDEVVTSTGTGATAGAKPIDPMTKRAVERMLARGAEREAGE